MAATYKKRRRAYEGEDARAEAVRRMQTEASVRSQLAQRRPHATDTGPRSHGGAPYAHNDPPPKTQQPVKYGPPAGQRQASEQLRRRANRHREVTTHGGAPATPRPVDPKRPRIPSPTTLRIKSGNQTLWHIAQNRLGSGKRWREIARASGIKDPRRIQLGQKITIPSQHGSTMRPSRPSGAGHSLRDFINHERGLRGQSGSKPPYTPRTAPTIRGPRANYNNQAQAIAEKRARLQRSLSGQGRRLINPGRLRRRPRAYGRIVR